jgi:EAL domain-containing protein (putative c-di-GMP-specific phosphodiesterase class I)
MAGILAQPLELKALGCDRGQGRLFARPGDALDVTPILAILKSGALSRTLGSGEAD